MTPVLQVAFGQLGIEEKPRGSNWGLDVQKYLKSVGIEFPASWCMAFVYWCVGQVFKPNILIKTGGVLRQWNECNRQLISKTPLIGSIFIMDLGKGLGHCGFVLEIDGEYIETLEGNTNDTGSREGYEVCKRKRKISTIKGFIKIPENIQQLKGTTP